MTILFLATFFSVFARAWQQINVMRGYANQAFFTSYVIALSDLMFIFNGYNQFNDCSYCAVLVAGTAGGMASYIVIKLRHKNETQKT